jgi:hypothetical protein
VRASVSLIGAILIHLALILAPLLATAIALRAGLIPDRSSPRPARPVAAIGTGLVVGLILAGVVAVVLVWRGPLPLPLAPIFAGLHAVTCAAAIFAVVSVWRGGPFASAADGGVTRRPA